MNNDPQLEPIVVAQQILKASDAISLEGQRSYDLIQAKAEAVAEYDKQRGVETAKLKLAGEPVTIIDARVKGNIFAELQAKIIAEETLKAHYCRMENLRGQMNALLSVNRHLSHV